LTIIYKSIIGRVSIATIDYQNGNSQTRHVFFFSGVSKISCGLDGLQPYTLMLSLFEIGWVCHISYHKFSVSKRGINKPPSHDRTYSTYPTVSTSGCFFGHQDSAYGISQASKMLADAPIDKP